MYRPILLLLILLALPGWANDGKSYAREYYSSGQLKAEGWTEGAVKTGFWKRYYENGSLASEGHFNRNQKHGYWYYYNAIGKVVKEGHYRYGSAEDWWIFYDIADRKTSKFQFQNNQKNGYALQYEGRKLVSAARYESDEKMGEWTSLMAFRRDNPGVRF